LPKLGQNWQTDEGISHLLAMVSAELVAHAENHFSSRKPDKMRALSVTTIWSQKHVGYRTTR
jgi:hypothetical protein